MKEEDYKKDTPTDYFASTYTPRPAGMTDDALKATEAAEIVTKGGALAKEAAHSHAIPLHEEKKSLVQKSHKKRHHRRHHKIQSLASKPDYRISAWTEDQHDVSHPKEWDEETKS